MQEPQEIWIQKWQPTPIFLAEKFHGQRTLAGYSPWGRKESDMTEQMKCLTVHIYKGILLSHKKEKKTGSLVEMCMDLETVTQSQVSQKKKNKYMLTHTCGI